MLFGFFGSWILQDVVRNICKNVSKIFLGFCSIFFVDVIINILGCYFKYLWYVIRFFVSYSNFLGCDSNFSKCYSKYFVILCEIFFSMLIEFFRDVRIYFWDVIRFFGMLFEILLRRFFDLL